MAKSDVIRGHPLRGQGPVRTALSTVDLVALRTRLRDMSDNELRRFGRDARAACNSMTGLEPDDPAREELIVRLQEATLEYRRRFVNGKQMARYIDDGESETL